MHKENKNKKIWDITWGIIMVGLAVILFRSNRPYAIMASIGFLGMSFCQIFYYFESKNDNIWLRLAVVIAHYIFAILAMFFFAARIFKWLHQ